ncbi:hypothetical protein MtrunA17_Chr4g0000101 [Medicago truncatula]|uniref:Uncharacterized protein n=1 Tax=Medicago truncatula TaxID=3880 RepID=A0A396HY16_MEDTR|nr:hypothetical protein MtrunA17_Chr4g0000101 [Medicago truncatula]
MTSSHLAFSFRFPSKIIIKNFKSSFVTIFEYLDEFKLVESETKEDVVVVEEDDDEAEKNKNLLIRFFFKSTRRSTTTTTTEMITITELP